MTDIVSRIHRDYIQQMENHRILRSPPDRMKVRVSIYDGHGLPVESMCELHAWLSGELAKIPEDCRDSAEMTVNTGMEYGEPSTDVEACYWRWETDEEMNERLSARAKLVAAAEAELSAKERRELAALKAKYEGGS